MKKYIKAPYVDLYLVALGFGLLSFLFKTPYFLIGSGLALTACLNASWAYFVAETWKKIAKAMGWVNSRFLLTILFLTLITPLALIHRIFRKEGQLENSGWKLVKNGETDFTKPW
jgi:hypothetical protein